MSQSYINCIFAVTTILMMEQKEEFPKETKMSAATTKEELRWWAMSAVYNRSMKVKQMLDGWGVENFVPMKTVVRTYAGRKTRQRIPAISNLIFVRASEERVQEVKERTRILQYLCMRQDGRNRRIIVPDDDMVAFQRVAGAEEEILYFRPEEIDFERGDRVRIHGGDFDGVEGVFVKVQGKRNKMVVVTIPTLVSVATLTFAPELLEKI